MKIVFRRDVISAAVAPLMSGVSTKMTLAATEGILIEAAVVTNGKAQNQIQTQRQEHDHRLAHGKGDP